MRGLCGALVALMVVCCFGLFGPPEADAGDRIGPLRALAQGIVDGRQAVQEVRAEADRARDQAIARIGSGPSFQRAVVADYVRPPALLLVEQPAAIVAPAVTVERLRVSQTLVVPPARLVVPLQPVPARLVVPGYSCR